MQSEPAPNPRPNVARCRVRYAGVWHSVRLINLSFSSITIIISGPVKDDVRMDVAVPGFPAKPALVSRVDGDKVDLIFETPIAWPDLTRWRDAAYR